MNTKIIQGKENFYNIYQKNKKGVDKKMNEIEIYTKNLPTTIEDVSKFVLFGREKLTSIRAEIRAIDKLQIAEEVRNQKKEEAQLLAEALLDAEVKLGELFQALPKDRSFRGNQWQKCSGELLPKTQEFFSKNRQSNNSVTLPFEDNQNNKDKTEKMVSDSSVDNQNANDSDVDSKNNKTNDSSVDSFCQSDSSVDLPKKEVIQNLGFNQKQAERFETLAKNKDIVEQVKQKARENDDIPTRTQVLSLAKARKQMQEQKEEEYKEFCINSEKGKKLFNQLVDSLGFIRRLKSEDIRLSMMLLDSHLSKEIIEDIQEVQEKLVLLKQEAEKYKGVKIWEDNEC